MITKEEFEKWVKFIAEQSRFAGTPISTLYNNFNKWEDRGSIARALAISEQFEPAIELMKTVVEHFEVNPPNTLDDEEQYAWALKDLNVWIWLYEEDAVKALGYIERSLNITEKWDESAFLVCKGEVWFDRLFLLHKLNRTDEALEEVESKIRSFEPKNYTLNSYVYWSLRFQAMINADNGNWEKACQLLKDAGHILYSDELEAAYAKQLDEIWEGVSQDPKGVYDELYYATGKSNVGWRI